MIHLRGISKTFKVAKRPPGAFSALKSLFHREYTHVHALRNISFDIEPGEIAAYIGPNGAGKSTTIKIMSGILTPDGGQCEIMGRTPWRERRAHVGHIGVVFGQRTQLWWDVPVIDSFQMLRDIYAVKEQDFKGTLDELVDALDIAAVLHTPLRQLSLGQRMRCEIAGSLLHRPELLFLDEPTIGLDAVSKLAVRAFLKRVNRERGTTIVLTTHDMHDIEALTERILLIGKGQLLFDGPLSAIRARHDRYRTLTASFAPYEGEPLVVPGAECIEWTQERAVYQMPSEDAPGVIAHLGAKLALTDLTSRGAELEDIIARLYEEYKL